MPAEAVLGWAWTPLRTAGERDLKRNTQGGEVELRYGQNRDACSPKSSPALVKGRPDLNRGTRIVFCGTEDGGDKTNETVVVSGFGARAYGDWGMAVGAAG
jgi:hypothetical protein